MTTSRATVEETFLVLNSCINDTVSTKELSLAMIGCEDSDPYGPSNHTAKMLLILLCNSIKRYYQSKQQSKTNTTTSNTNQLQYKVIITIYKAKENDYPQPNEWDTYHGILIPGSLSSAYDTVKEPWIQVLQNVIQSEIHAKCRKTLAICFGHQAFAHSFGLGKEFCSKSGIDDDVVLDGNDNLQNEEKDGGVACRCPAGSQVGPKEFELSKSGGILWNRQTKQSVNNGRNSAPLSSSSSSSQKKISLLYTHSDMVQSLPSCALSLGGTDKVPIQAAMYFASSKKASEFCELNENNDNIVSDEVNPYAFTFQAHPEYASDYGLNQSFIKVAQKMNSSKLISNEYMENATKCANSQYDSIEQDSVNLMMIVGTTLGWF